MGISVHISWVSTIAGASSLAVDDDLSVKTDRSGGLEVIKDVKAVSNCRGSTLSPARSAVLGNVLVLVPRQVILAIHVSPVNNCGQRVIAVDVPRVGGRLKRTILECGFFDSASTSSRSIKELLVRNNWYFI